LVHPPRRLRRSAPAAEAHVGSGTQDPIPVGPPVLPARLEARNAFSFADFALTPPRVLRVLSIEDPIGREVDLTLRPAS
jgi:hypothetical protein